MAKLPFSKLGLKVDNEVTIIEYNEQNIEVRHYLPFMTKVEMISKIINSSVDDNNFYNPMRVKLYMYLETVSYYTNLTFTPKQLEDPFKIYDLLESSGLFTKIIEAIGDEWQEIQENTWAVIKNIYEYKNSAMGILEMVTDDYSGLNLDAQNIQNALSDPQNLTLLKDVMTKLG